MLHKCQQYKHVMMFSTNYKETTHIVLSNACTLLLESFLIMIHTILSETVKERSVSLKSYQCKFRSCFPGTHNCRHLLILLLFWRALTNTTDLFYLNWTQSSQPTNIRVIILIQNYYLNCWLLNKLKIIFIGINSDYFWPNFFLPHEVISLSFQESKSCEKEAANVSPNVAHLSLETAATTAPWNQSKDPLLVPLICTTVATDSQTNSTSYVEFFICKSRSTVEGHSSTLNEKGATLSNYQNI